MADSVSEIPTGITSGEAVATILPAALEKRSLQENGSAGEAANEEGAELAGGPVEKESTKGMGNAKEEDAKVLKVPVLALFSFADKIDVLLIVVGSIAAAAAGAAMPLLTFLLGDLINAFGQHLSDTDAMVHAINSVVLKFVYLGIGSGIAGYLEVACWTIAGERQAARIRSRYLRAILRQDISFFDTESSTGEVIARMSGDTVLIQDGLGEKVGKFIQLFATFVGGFIVAFIRSWKLTLVLMAVMPLVITCGMVTMIFISKTTNRTQKAYAGAGRLVEQVIGAIRTVAAYTGEKDAAKDYDLNLKQAEKAGIFQGLAAGFGVGFLLGMMFAAYALALWYGSKLVLNEGLSGGQVINVIYAVLSGSMSLSQASPSWGAIASAQAAAYNIFEVIKRNPVIDIYDTSGLVPDEIKGDVELRNVDFCYPTRPDVVVFSNFSLTMPAGKTVALVGESGSGKSTVVSLIERFYDPQSGAVLVDGLDIRSIQLQWLRQQIGLVSQEPVLFSTSVRENIAYGKENATMEEIETAAHLANAAKFITKIPQGYDTLVGERGIQLSGGQKQRVAIARAILKNPRILLLDEATSALDAESERVVQDALDRVMTDRTTVVVAHRLTTIRNADMIAVVQRGVIVETGTHNELIRKEDGAYSQLVRLQERYGKSENVAEKPNDLDFVPETAEGDIMARISRSSASSSFRPSLSLLGLPGVLGGSTRGGRMSAEVRNEVLEMERRSSAARSEDVEIGKKAAVVTALKTASVLRLAKLNRPELPLFVVGSIASAAAGLIFPVFGLLLSSVINAFFEPPHKLRKDVNFWSIMFVVMAIGIATASPIQKFTFSIIGERLIRRVRRMTFEKIICQEISWFDEESNSSGAISSRLSADAAAVRGIVGDALSLLVQNVATVVAGLVIAFSACWQLALVILALLPLLAVQGYGQVKWMQGFGEDAKVKYEDASRVANDGVGSIRTVASFVAEDRICNLYDEKCKGPVRSGIRMGLISGISLGFANLVMPCTYALSFWVGGKLVQGGEATFEEVFRVFLAITLSSLGVTQAAGMSPDISKVNVAVKSIFAVLDRKSKIDPSDMSGTTPKAATGEIEFRNVSFFYPTRPDIQIFHNLSFNVQAGQTLALVGESGSGKSTVVSLIERFYEPQSGEILVDRVNIQMLQLKWLRQQIGLVSQEPVLFDESVQWNIRYGQEGEASEAEVQAAADAANAHRFISGLPDGYRTRVGERGTQLSGGQKQRVAIARAILRDPKILLLDEATSALDAESEHVVQEALDRIMVARTTIVVAHRLSTVRNADIIAVVKDGAIVEQGKHDDLIARDGAYASLVKLHISSSS